jgi:hypothetical protein
VGFGTIKTDRFDRFLNMAMTFENIRIVPPSRRLDITAEQVYDLLDDNEAYWSKVAYGLTRCDQHTWDEMVGSTKTRQDETAMEGLCSKIEELFKEWIPEWSDNPVGDQRAVGMARRRPVNWTVLLRSRFNAVSRPAIEQQWAAGSRKTAWMYPRLLLPGEREIETRRTSVLIALDSSGSIRPDMLDRLLAIARSLPEDRFEVEAVSFDTRVYPLDISAEHPSVLGGGGTSFQAVEEFARARKPYPRMIVVLTDGQACRPDILHPGRWLWLLTEPGTDRFIEDIGRKAWIKELVSSAR